MLHAILGYTVTNAEVAELADAPALGAGGRKAVGVRVPSSALLIAYKALPSLTHPFSGLTISKSTTKLRGHWR